MARPKKDAPVNLTERHVLTTGLMERLTCPEGKDKAFLRDSEVPGLCVRVTAKGAKSFVFQTKTKEKSFFSRTIGNVRAWTIEQARTEARRLAVMLDSGQDPRELERQQQLEREALRKQAEARALTVGELWPLYLENGRPKRKEEWKQRYLEDLHKMAAPGGVPKKRGQGLTRPGPLYPLLALPLAEINEDALTKWHEQEALSGRHQAARALMMFRGFLRWCSTKPEYRGLADRNAGAAPAILETLPPNTQRTDKLRTEHIREWWAAVERLPNPIHSAYLRALLLTGARREEMAALRWRDVNWQWRTLTIADKVEQTRTIPLTPYIAAMLDGLPRWGEYVFHSNSEVGHVVDARSSMEKVLAECGVEHLTFHGLRRTFNQIARRFVPAGVPAQICGHKPSAVADGYFILELDELRPYHEQIEAHFLKLANVQFDTKAEPGKLRAVT